MKVSIVISNHNYGPYLCKAVESALGQEHPDVEVIVVDDGSTDDSRDRMRAYDGRAEIILKDNGGQASALNVGFMRAVGEAVIFLDADDVLAPTVASRAARAFTAQPGAARIQFRMDVIDADGHSLGRLNPPVHRPMHSGDLRRAELASPFDLVFIPTSGNVFRAQALRRIMPIPEAEYGRLGADYYLVHLTTLLGDVISVEDVGASYRVHGSNNHELIGTDLDLEHVRRLISYQQTTLIALAALADELGLERPEPILSMSNIINRLISLKLDPDLHPVAPDTSAALLTAAVRAAGRRFDVSWRLRALLVCWCAAIAVAPRGLARWLASVLVFPESRPALTRMSGRLHRRPTVARPTTTD